MDFHSIPYILNILLLFAIPIGLGVYLVRKFELEGSLWWTGAIVYIVALIGHSLLDNYLILPASYSMSQSPAFPSLFVLITFAIAMGLSVAIWEGLLCYGMFRWWMKSARTWLDGILIGVGLGGAAAILTGFRDIYDFVNYILYRNLIVANASTPEAIPPGMQADVNAFWSAPWYSTFNHTVQQFFMILILVGLSMLVLQVFIRKQWFWVLLAIGFGALVVAANIILTNLANQNIAVISLGLFAAASVALVFRLRWAEPEQDKLPQPGSLITGDYRMKNPKTIQETLDDLRKDTDK